ncbi:MAG: response regulator [Fulvivirga sp.]
MKNIVLIDDDPFYVKIMGKKITDWGYMVTSFHSVEEALPCLNNNLDLIILDHNFEFHDKKGSDYIPLLKTHAQSSAVLYVSSETAPEVINKSLSNGADMYITKNENIYNDLNQVIQKLINQKNHSNFWSSNSHSSSNRCNSSSNF